MESLSDMIAWLFDCVITALCWIFPVGDSDWFEYEELVNG